MHAGHGRTPPGSPRSWRRFTIRFLGAVLRRLGVAASLAAALACSGAADPIQRLLDAVVAAVEDRSADGVTAHLAPGFRGGGLEREEARATLRRYFTAYRTVGVEIYDVSITREASSAHVGLTAEFSGEARRLGGLGGFLPPAALLRFDLRLELEGDRWLIAGAEWQALGPPGR